jgi:hypothetical protein
VAMFAGQVINPSAYRRIEFVCGNRHEVIESHVHEPFCSRQVQPRLLLVSVEVDHERASNKIP